MTASPRGSGAERSKLPVRSTSPVAGELVRTKIYDLGDPSLGMESQRGHIASAEAAAARRYGGRARKVSVSMPEELTVAVQERVGRGAFSQYVTEAVARQLEGDLLSELAGLLEAEHGPVPSELVAEAAAAWPDVE